MMDELELLKKDWQKKTASLPKLSYDEIYKMILKKSSSIVKWIFYISIAEFVFWILIGQVPVGESSTSELKNTNTLYTVLEVLSYCIMLFFIVKFYLNYKKINTTDSARALMKNILKTRRTVVTYVWVSLSVFAISLVIVTAELIFYEPEFTALNEKLAAADNTFMVYALIGIIVIGCILVTGVLLWLFYRLIYGILLKRLQENYKELKKLEV
jgi:membrane-associated HD superfamily phosphohydrolase